MEAGRTNSQVEGIIRAKHPKQQPSVSALHLCLSASHISIPLPQPPPGPAAARVCVDFVKVVVNICHKAPPDILLETPQQ